MLTDTPDYVAMADARLDSLGYDPEVDVLKVELPDKGPSGRDYYTIPLFQVDGKTGDIKLHYSDLLGYAKGREVNKVNKDNVQFEAYYRMRWAQPELHRTADGKAMKYYTPKGEKAELFVPLPVVHKVVDKTRIHTLWVVEGEFKAYAGAKQGLDIVGTQGIHNTRGEDKQALKDLRKIITTCGVQNVVMLLDADCMRPPLPGYFEVGDDGLPTHDLKERPLSFYSAVRNLKEALKAKSTEHVDMYMSYLLAVGEPAGVQEMPNQVRHDIKGVDVKGLDDLYVYMGERAGEVTEDAQRLAASSRYFRTVLLTGKNDLAIKNLFGLASAEQYYGMYADYIQDKAFRWGHAVLRMGKDGIETLRHGEAGKFIRVGDDYFLIADIPTATGALQRERLPRLKGTITDDHGKSIFKDIPKYLKFVNIPDNKSNYKEVRDNCYNIYYPCLHERIPGEWVQTEAYLRHLFGYEDNQYEIALDYFTLLHNKPTQQLPVLALVSEEQETGKSSLINWLRLIYGENVKSIDSDMFGSNFNSSWAGSLVLGIEEAQLDRRELLDKLKRLSTESKLLMEAKGKDANTIDFYAKFILLSNNETSFLQVDKHQRRFWVRKVPRLKVIDPLFIDKLEAEIPAWLHFLETREIGYKRKTRMWFDPIDLRTEALNRVNKANRQWPEGPMYEAVKSYYQTYTVDSLKATPRALRMLLKEMGITNVSEQRIAQQLRAWGLKSETNGSFAYYAGVDMNSGAPYERHDRGKYYEIKAADILDSDDLAELEHDLKKTENNPIIPF